MGQGWRMWAAVIGPMLQGHPYSGLSNAKSGVHVMIEAIVSSPQVEDLRLLPSTQQVVAVMLALFCVLSQPSLVLMCLNDGFGLII